ncbi:VOC family protein [Acetobacter sp. TBRC 12305]|uniref:VOC family protein n=1 Tax=Acetobacter garciniae TaxID=2817435 RepID=A0A939KNA5_9PROT|nr:VOC family protein [Acetobacter garciniae]MBO1325480.1 VOC family protein [Acetobacter garciniae]MBX0345348.1 VOC family protein [Acetobacter garciniae]
MTNPAGAVTRLMTVYVPSAGSAEATRFYTDCIGLPLKFADGERWVQFGTGNANFALAGASEYPAGAQGAVAVFEVDDMAAFRARCAAANVTEMGLRDMGDHGQVLTLKDPDGNIVQFFSKS